MNRAAVLCTVALDVGRGIVDSGSGFAILRLKGSSLKTPRLMIHAWDVLSRSWGVVCNLDAGVV